MPIPRRSFLQGMAVGALGLGLPYPGRDALAITPDDGPPDIVVVVLDALRAESLPIYGCPRATAPFFVDLAKRSTLYERCYSTSSWTKPAVTSLLTGLAPIQHGDNAMATTLPKASMSFAKRLGQSGYRTGFFTANLILANEYGAKHHFEHTASVQPDRMNGYHLMDKVGAWLDKIAAASGSAPVCSYVHFFQPHAHYDPPAEFLDWAVAESRRVPPDPNYLFDHHRDVLMSPYANGDHGRLPPAATGVLKSRDPIDHLIRYEANVRFADSILADFFKLWNERRAGRRTVFLVTADHGESLGEHGLFASHGKLLSNSLLHVPLLLHDTGDPRAFNVGVDVSHLDVSPSILALAGLDEMSGALGEASIHVRGEVPTHSQRERPVFSQFVSQEFGVAQGAEAAVAITAGRWRLVYNEACGLGPANLMSARMGEPFSRATRTRALPEPRTKLRRPTPVSPDAVVESLALHAANAVYGRSISFGGLVRVEDGTKGHLTIRFRRPGRKPHFERAYACEGGETRLDGELPALFSGLRLGGEEVVCEATWGKPVRGSSKKDVWQQLFSFPIQWGGEEAPPADLALTALQVEPAMCLAGGEVRIETIWRCERTPSALPSYQLRMFGSDAKLLVEETARFMPSQLPNETRLASLLEPGFSFDQIYRVYIPKDAAPGKYSLEISGTNSRARSVPFEIAENSREALEKLTEMEMGLPHFAALARYEGSAGSDDGSGTMRMLRRLQHRFPEEGHFHYLEALREPDSARRQEKLKHCLERTPYHLAALGALNSDSAETQAVRRLLAPSRLRDIRFGDGLRMYGYELQRPASGNERVVYLTIYWEVLSPVSVPLTAEVMCEGVPTTWYLGAVSRPTQQWKVGEAVVETVRLPIPEKPAGSAESHDAMRSFFLQMSVYPYWDMLHSGWSNRPLLKAFGENAANWADLGKYQWEDLPRASHDPLVGKRASPHSFELFDLIKDPMERRDMKYEQPEVFARLHRQFLKLTNDLASSAPALDQKEADLTDEKIEQLRAIGYVE